MSERIRVGNRYNHDEYGEVITTHHDHENQIWFRGVKSKDNAGVISTTQWVKQSHYKNFLGSVTMRDYPDEWQALRQVVLERDDQTCQGCGAGVSDDAEHHVHHIVPLGAGGTNSRRNLITLCDECHGRIHGGPC